MRDEANDGVVYAIWAWIKYVKLLTDWSGLRGLEEIKKKSNNPKKMDRIDPTNPPPYPKKEKLE